MSMDNSKKYKRRLPWHFGYLIFWDVWVINCAAQIFVVFTPAPHVQVQVLQSYIYLCKFVEEMYVYAYMY